MVAAGIVAINIMQSLIFPTLIKTSLKIITVYHGCSWHSCHKYYAIWELASHNDEKVASSKKSTYFITRIEKQYSIYDQNG